MMLSMKTQDPHADLQDGFEPAELPPPGPDGAPQIPPMRTMAPPRPSLCQAGPCRNYHRLVTQVDAESPRAVRLPIAPGQGIPGTWDAAQGTMYRAAAAFHVQTHHYCYPNVGIEMPLGDLPVVECSLWNPDPELYEPSAPRAGRQAAFWVSSAGTEWLARLAAWNKAREDEDAESAEAERLIAQSMAGMAPQISCQSCGGMFDESEIDIESRCSKCRGQLPTLKNL